MKPIPDFTIFLFATSCALVTSALSLNSNESESTEKYNDGNDVIATFKLLSSKVTDSVEINGVV